VNVSVLRTAFDKVGGLGLTGGLRTPKRPDHMPEVLMTLRHSHAVACLRAGMDDRSLQVRLGHASIETTMLYRRFVPYTPWVSPLDLVPVQPVPATEERPPAASLPQEGFLTRALRTIQSFVIPRPMPSGP
jgi:hypothetical protein